MNTLRPSDQLSILSSAKRVVIKVGSNILVDDRQISPSRIAEISSDIVSLMQKGVEVVLVTSGAVATGLGKMGKSKRPRELRVLQMAAAIGQGTLMNYYSENFAKYDINVGQVLLTHDDFHNRTRFLNLRNSVNTMLSSKVVPIVNENDVISVDELKFGDNDALASLLAIMIDADALILLTSTNGLYSEIKSETRISSLPAITKDTLGLAEGKTSEFSTGGMLSKLSSAASAAKAGLAVVIAPGRTEQIASKVISGEDIGTFIYPSPKESILGKKRWIKYFPRTQGTIVVNDNAIPALVNEKRSLLAVGITQVIGKFDTGDLVSIFSGSNVEIARGLVTCDSTMIDRVKGLSTSEIHQLLSVTSFDEVICRDNLVTL